MKQILEQEDEDESIIMDAVCLDLYSEYDDLMPDTSPGVEDEEETKKLQSNPFKKKSVAKHQRYDASSHQGKNSLLDLINSSSNIRVKTDSPFTTKNKKKRRATTFDSKKLKKTKRNIKKKKQRSIFNFFS